jgi:hypothetical protein
LELKKEVVTMKHDDLEDELKKMRFDHLTREEIVSYRDGKLNRTDLARVEAHLNLCLFCEKSLQLLQEELAALENPDIAAEDVAFVDELLFVAYWEQVVASWRAFFGGLMPAHRGGGGGKGVWRWESEDGGLKAWATFEMNTDLTVHFSSTKPDMEGTRLRIRLGQFSREVTFERASESEVRAEFSVPGRKRPRKLEDFSITATTQTTDGRR